jgi:pyrroline-5-carboxylate reductase
MDSATGVAGCGPAFVYRFVQALADAGVELGLDPAAATRLARGALRSAAAGLDTGEGLDALIDRIASPGGVTRAGLEAMQAEGWVDDLARATVAAALRREREVGAS